MSQKIYFYPCNKAIFLNRDINLQFGHVNGIRKEYYIYLTDDGLDKYLKYKAANPLPGLYSKTYKLEIVDTGKRTKKGASICDVVDISIHHGRFCPAK